MDYQSTYCTPGVAYAQPLAYNPGWTMTTPPCTAAAAAFYTTQGYGAGAPLPPQQYHHQSNIAYDHSRPILPLIIQTEPAQYHHHHYIPRTPPITTTPYLQQAPIFHQSPVAVTRPVYYPQNQMAFQQPTGARATLGRMGVLGKHEKKRMHKMQKEQDKMMMRQTKAMNYGHMY